ncbi:MAG TPA: response regulator transcription factor [Candidatus Saccharimonadales bacterium]|nr:response regulator transcription factor [Candidatus Saccharimonadales bacterium]
MLKDLTLNTPRAASAPPKPANPNNPAQQSAQPAPIRGTQEKITVLLADDHAVVREGLRLLLESTEDIQVVGEVENGRKAVEMAKSLRPDVVLLDLAMPNLNGLEATRQILKEVPGVKVLILSSFSDDDRVQELIEAGAIGYLAKQTAAHDLVKGIREAKKGNATFSPSISRRLLEKCRETFVNGGAVKRKGNTLTTREAEVLQLIAEGYANKQIAAELGISIKTVEKHRQQVMNKLNIHDVAGLTRHAIQKGIIDPVEQIPQSA